ncbi:ABC transporter permease [Thermus oshimai]|uniref:ABC transporter permease n=1 Tax=Thermus oshimai TaxID=56957 RepID=UPI000371714B|nr:ABC transporter permease [Thermus oshimai]
MAKRPRALDPWVVLALWRREMLRYLRDRSQPFGGLSRTVLWLLILGFGLGASFRDIEGYTYAQYIFPGVVTLNILFASLQSAITLVWDREVGLLREVLVSPAPMLSVALGKLLGGATVAVIQGLIPFLFAPLIGVSLTLFQLLLALGVMFSMGVLMSALGVVIASRLSTFEGFGSISNGVIQPLYFLSGSIFPLKGIIGGVGFLDLPENLRAELERLGIHTIGGGWMVQLPAWLQVLVYLNPVSYQLDLLRYVTLGYQQLPLVADLLVVSVLPLLAAVFAALAIARMRRR